MKKAYLFFATGFEEVEALTVVDILRRGGVDCKTVSIMGDYDVTSSHNVTIRADLVFEHQNLSDGDMLIMPGGIPGTPNLRACDTLCQQLQQFAKEEKWVAAVCAAPTVLGELGILKDHQATCYPSFADQLICGQYVKKPVVCDGKVITSRGMGTCIEFAAEIITALKDAETAEHVKTAIIYNDQYED